MWALWPGSTFFYQGTVIEKKKRTVAVRYFDNEIKELKYRHVEVREN